MPESVSDYLNVSKTELENLGAVDYIVDVDSKLFIDPKLLSQATTPELKKSHEMVTDHFRKVMKLLKKSEDEGDTFWSEAEKRFKFHELQGLGMGYSSEGTGGKGFGKKLRKKVLRVAKETLEAGIEDPEFFELIDIFQKGIAADRISDMIGRIISPRLFEFSERVFQELEIPNSRLVDFEFKSIDGKEYIFEIVLNKYNGEPLLMLPMEILNDLPSMKHYEELSIVINKNKRVREDVNNIAEKALKRAVSPTQLEKMRKADLKRILLNNQNLFKELINEYKQEFKEGYDFERDPQGELIWYFEGRECTSANELKLDLPDNPTVNDIFNLIQKICDQFAFLVEKKSLYELLYDSDGSKKKERAAQLLFLGIAHPYCKYNQLDISPEVDTGRGLVDFKFSYGIDKKILVEVKLSTNKRLVHGYEKQLNEYLNAEDTENGIYLVIDVDSSYDTSQNIKNLEDRVDDLQKNFPDAPILKVVDGTKKEPASKI